MKALTVLSLLLFIFAVTAKLALGTGPSWMTVAAAFSVAFSLGFLLGGQLGRMT